MINEIVFEVVKAVLIAAVGAFGKMWLDMRGLKADLDMAFEKIRALEKNPKVEPPKTE